MADRQLKRKRLIGRFSIFLSVLIAAQALLAPVYVPILFGANWEPAILLLSLLCLSAIPRSIADLHACLARNSGLTQLEATWNGAYTLLFLLCISLTAGLGLESMASVLIVVNLCMALVIAFTCWKRLADDAFLFPANDATA